MVGEKTLELWMEIGEGKGEGRRGDYGAWQSVKLLASDLLAKQKTISRIKFYKRKEICCRFGNWLPS